MEGPKKVGCEEALAVSSDAAVIGAVFLGAAPPRAVPSRKRAATRGHRARGSRLDEAKAPPSRPAIGCYLPNNPPTRPIPI